MGHLDDWWRAVEHKQKRSDSILVCLFLPDLDWSMLVHMYIHNLVGCMFHSAIIPMHIIWLMRGWYHLMQGSNIIMMTMIISTLTTSEPSTYVNTKHYSTQIFPTPQSALFWLPSLAITLSEVLFLLPLPDAQWIGVVVVVRNAIVMPWLWPGWHECVTHGEIFMRKRYLEIIVWAYDGHR